MKKAILAFSRVSPSILERYADKYDSVIMSPEPGDMDAHCRLGEVELDSRDEKSHRPERAGADRGRGLSRRIAITSNLALAADIDRWGQALI